MEEEQEDKANVLEEEYYVVQALVSLFCHSELLIFILFANIILFKETDDRHLQSYTNVHIFCVVHREEA